MAQNVASVSKSGTLKASQKPLKGLNCSYLLQHTARNTCHAQCDASVASRIASCSGVQVTACFGLSLSYLMILRIRELWCLLVNCGLRE